MDPVNSFESRLAEMKPGPALVTADKFRDLSGGVAVERASMAVIAAVCEAVGSRTLSIVGRPDVLYCPFDSESAHMRGYKAPKGGGETGLDPVAA